MTFRGCLPTFTDNAEAFEKGRPLTAPADTAKKPFRARVTSVEQPAPDTRIYKLEAEGAPPHRAGQYAIVHAEGFQPREYSIASPPESGLLEFHIKSTGRGGMSDHIFETWKQGAEVLIAAPFGDHFWHPAYRPLLALAGGVGIAPLKAVIEAHVMHAPHAPVHLYWGVRDAGHLYLDKFFRALAEEHQGFHYIPLLQEGSTHRTGFIAPALLQDFKELSEFSIYLAGPQPMVEATLPTLLQMRADKDWLFSDAFKVGL